MEYKIRIATKQHEKKIRDIAKRLRREPYIIIPECKCKKCPFEKMKKIIDKFDDEQYLNKVAKGRDLLAALASTILITEDEKIPYIAFKKIGRENVIYAKRGKAKDEYLIAIQNWDKPNLRMLGYIKFARKKRINLFSLPEKLICSDDMPPEFFEFLNKKFECDEDEYISIKWQGKEIKVCGDGNSLMEMSQYFYYPDFSKKIEITIKADVVKCGKKCDECIIKKELNDMPSPEFYLKGRISDKKYIENYKNKVLWSIEKKKIFVADGICYGNDANEFIKLLNPKEWEMEEVRNILENETNAIFIEQPSSAKLLEKYGIDTAKLKEDWERMKKDEILSKLPVIEGGKISKFADEIARAYKIEGNEGIAKIIKSRKMDVKEKAITYAFLTAADSRKDDWRYSKMEREFGEHLVEYARKILNSDGEEYKKAVKNFAKEAGE